MILGRFIAGELARGWLVMIVILASLFGLLALLDEADRISERYTFLHVLQYVLYTTPQRVLELSPVIAALGTVVAFAQMSRNSELVVIRASGVSIRRLLGYCAIPTLLLVALIAVASEFVVSNLHQHAETQRAVLRSGNLNLLKQGGIWASSNHRYFNVGHLRLGTLPEDISVYEVDDAGALVRVVEAQSAEPIGSREWRLIDVVIKQWADNKVSTRHEDELVIDEFWSENELPTLGNSYASMSPSTLSDYADYLESTGQPARAVQLAFWQRVTGPIFAATMVLLCFVLGLSFGSTRSAQFGLRVFGTTVVSVGAYLLTQIFHTSGQLAGLSEMLIVLVPIGVVVVVSAALLLPLTRHR